MEGLLVLLVLAFTAGAVLGLFVGFRLRATPEQRCPEIRAIKFTNGGCLTVRCRAERFHMGPHAAWVDVYPLGRHEWFWRNKDEDALDRELNAPTAHRVPGAHG